MSHEISTVVLIAGPNGAGKSTCAPHLLKGALALREFVNADVIARGLSGFAPDDAALRAGKIMWERIRELASERRTFALETTLGGRSLASWLRNEMKPAGYQVKLFFLWLPSPELAIDRVTARVRAGGHDVGESTIRRRYRLGIRNLFDLYMPLLDQWRIYNNAGAQGPVLVASGRRHRIRVTREADWRRIEEQAEHA